MKNQKNKSKRLKHCFSSATEVISLWANQSQSHAYCRNAKFRGHEVYSYGSHYLLGKLIDYNGRKIALINFEHYSRTTSGHSWAALNAAQKAGFIALRVDGLFSESAIRSSLEKSQNNIIDDLIHYQNNGLNDWDKKSIAEDIATHNKNAKALGHADLVLKVPKSFIDYVKNITKFQTMAARDISKRKQASFSNYLNYSF